MEPTTLFEDACKIIRQYSLGLLTTQECHDFILEAIIRHTMIGV